MQLRTHIVIGAAIGLWVGGPIGGALGAFAGVVPDVDLDVGSVARGARWLGVIGIAGGALGGYLLNSPTIAGLSIAGGFLLLMLIRLPHRGPTHSLALALLWSLLGGLWLRDPGLIGAWAAGYLSHLFLDALTPQGIPMALAPVRRAPAPGPMADRLPLGSRDPDPGRVDRGGVDRMEDGGLMLDWSCHPATRFPLCPLQRRR